MVLVVNCIYVYWRLVFDVEEIKLLLIMSCEQWSFKCISTFQDIFSSNFFKQQWKWREYKVTVNGILQSVDLKFLKILTVKDNICSNF